MGARPCLEGDIVLELFGSPALVSAVLAAAALAVSAAGTKAAARAARLPCSSVLASSAAGLLIFRRRNLRLRRVRRGVAD